MKYFAYIIMAWIFASTAIAGLPPTATQGSAGGGYKTTFNFNFSDLSASYSGTTATFTLPSLISAGSCTNCSVTFDAKGRATAYSSGGSSSIAYSYMFLDSGNGTGSTNTRVRRYSGLRANVGSDFSITQSSTNGDKVTVNSSGTYVVCSGDLGASGPVQSGIVINGANGTTDVASLTYAQGVRTAGVANGTVSMTGCWAGPLSTNDYFWVQTNGAADSTTTTAYLMAAKVSSSSESNIYVENGSGHGSTNTKIRTFSNVRSNNGGSDISYTSSATLGDSFTVNTGGNYFVCYGDANSAGSGFGGVTVNDQALTTSISSSSYLNGVRAYGSASTVSNGTFATCYSDWFPAGTVIRAHDDGSNNATDVTSYFFITKMGNTTDSSLAYYNNGSGHGSSNTKVRTYSTLAKIVSANATGNSSSVEGNSIYAATDGIYTICSDDQISGGTPILGVAVNLLVGTTSATSLAYSDGLRGLYSTGVNNTSSTLCSVLYLPAGSRVYSVDNGTNSSSDFRSYFGMKRVY